MFKLSQFLIISVFLLFFCQPDKPSKKLPEKIEPIHVEYDSVYQTKSYSLKDSSGSYTFVVYLSKPNKGIIGYRYNGYQPLSFQTGSMGLILKSIFKDSSLQVEFTTLQWGRLNSSTNRDLTLSKRLAIATAQSDAWNKKYGKPFKGHENEFIQKLANTGQIYPELVKLFAGFGYKIKVSGVEKVLVQQAHKMTFWNEISDQVSSDDKLPFDCQTWFTIERVQL